MSVFLTGCFDINDLESYKRYMAESHPVMARWGARVVAAGQPATVLEGQPPQVTVIVEFESREKAEAYYHSPEYQTAARIRQGASTGWLEILEGR